MSHCYLPTNHKRTTQLTPAQKERARQMAAEGFNNRAIAERLGISREYARGLTNGILRKARATEVQR